MIIEYRGYRANLEYDEEDEIWVGEIIGIANASINFHGSTKKKAEVRFREMIRNYLEYRKKPK